MTPLTLLSFLLSGLAFMSFRTLFVVFLKAYSRYDSGYQQFPPVEFLQSNIGYFELIGANFLCIQT